MNRVYEYCTFHLKEVESMDGSKHCVVVQTELELGRNSRFKLHVFVEAAISTGDSVNQRARYLSITPKHLHCHCHLKTVCYSIIATNNNKKWHFPPFRETYLLATLEWTGHVMYLLQAYSDNGNTWRMLNSCQNTEVLFSKCQMWAPHPVRHYHG